MKLIEKELEQMLAKRDRIRAKQLGDRSAGRATRARTTTSNARADECNDRIEYLRRILKAAAETAVAVIQSEKPLYVLAHTSVQIEVFMRSMGLNPKGYIRVNAPDPCIIGRRRDRPVFMLPGWATDLHIDEVVRLRHALDWWCKSGGATHEVLESTVTGKP